MRLIDADAFESVLDFADSDVCEEFPDGYCEFGFSREKIRELLRDIPTVDAVPVVRCRECKHRKYDDIFGMLWCNLDSCTKRVKPYDFCSHGERKEGGDNG